MLIVGQHFQILIKKTMLILFRLLKSMSVFPRVFLLKRINVFKDVSNIPSEYEK